VRLMPGGAMLLVRLPASGLEGAQEDRQGGGRGKGGAEAGLIGGRILANYISSMKKQLFPLDDALSI